MAPTYNASHLIPIEMRISGADSNAYKIGLSLYKPQNAVKRKWFNHPLIVLFCLAQHLIKYLIVYYINLNPEHYSHEIHAKQTHV